MVKKNRLLKGDDKIRFSTNDKSVYWIF